jgi:hypothetical protein
MALPGADNLLWMEEAIITRLQGFAPEGTRVFSSADLAVVEERAQHVPAIHVVYGGSAPGSQAPGEALIEQTWLVIAADRSSVDIPSGLTARARVGATAAVVLRALLGWTPEKGVRPLDMLSAPPASYSSGFVYVPIAFRARFNVKGD